MDGRTDSTMLPQMCVSVETEKLERLRVSVSGFWGVFEGPSFGTFADELEFMGS